MIENFEAEKLSWPMRILVKLAGCLDPDGKVPLDLRMTFAGRKDEARKSLQQIFDWEPEKVILAHGRCYLENGMEELKRAFRWLDR